MRSIIVAALTEQLYQSIKLDILLRKLVPGQKLIYKDLARIYGASETPIKQALNRLVADGIVLIESNKGMWVKKFDWYEIESILDTRLMFELYNAERIRQSINNNVSLQKQFEKNLAEHARIASTYDPEDIRGYVSAIQIDGHFHELLMRCTGNTTMVNLYTKLNAFAFSYHTFRLQSKARIETNVREHTNIYQALLSNDPEKARQAIIDHNRSSKENTTLLIQISGEDMDSISM